MHRPCTCTRSLIIGWMEELPNPEREVLCFQLLCVCLIAGCSSQFLTYERPFWAWGEFQIWLSLHTRIGIFFVKSRFSSNSYTWHTNFHALCPKDHFRWIQRFFIFRANNKPLELRFILMYRFNACSIYLFLVKIYLSQNLPAIPVTSQLQRMVTSSHMPPWQSTLLQNTYCVSPWLHNVYSRSLQSWWM